MTRVTVMEADQTEVDVLAVDRPRPKVGRIPVTLRLLNESETAEAQNDWHEVSARKSDTQFMLLLVTLFIIVNLTLVTLLNHKEKPVAVAPVVAAAPHAAPLAATPATKLELPVAAAAIPSAPAPAPLAALKPPAPPAPQAYITPPSSSSSRATAAPFQPVTVSEHATPAPAAPAPTPVAASGESLTVIHSQYPATATVIAAPDMAPAAGTPTPAAIQPSLSPEAAKQEMLSVLNKD